MSASIIYHRRVYFGVRPEKEKSLVEKMHHFGIFEKDILERFVASSGKGGQNVNKVATCVYLKHLPTGIEVKCQQARSQGLNRFLARRILADQIERRILGEKSAAIARIEKIRRQKRRRSRRAKEKMLASKRHRSALKELRRLPTGLE